MEDVEFKDDHEHDVLPEAGNDLGDPLRPEIDEENSVPNPPIAEPSLDMEVTEDIGGMPDKDDVEEAGLSDNESVLSEVDEAQFDDFEIGDIAVEERPAQMIDDTNVGLIGVHKRKRAEGEGVDAPKKKKKKADKPRRKKNRDDDVDAANDLGERKSRRSKKEGRVRAATPEAENEDHLTPEERMYVFNQHGLLNTNGCTQAGNALSIEQWTRRLGRRPRAGARRVTSISIRWPMRRLKTCADGWQLPLKLTTTDGNAANQLDTS
jgi:hypothetical protein